MVARQGRGYEAGVWEQGCGLIPQLPTTMLADSLLLRALFFFFPLQAPSGYQNSTSLRYALGLVGTV